MSLHVRAPLRIDFAGGWSDDLSFSESGGGCVVNAAIASYMHVDFLTGGKTIRLHEEKDREHVTITSPAQLLYDGRLDRHKAALNMLPVTGGIEILSRSDVPPGCGLGESAALDIALLTGLARGRLEDYDADELVELGIMLDHGELGFSGHRQDHVAAVSGGFLELSFDGENIERHTLAVSEDLAGDLAEHLVLAYTGQTHFSAQTYRRIWDAYRLGDSRIVDAMRSMRDLARDVGRALERGDWQALAEITDGDWTHQQMLDAAMTTPHTRSIEAAMRDAGSWGVTGVGEGAGGCLLAICPHDRREAVEAAASGCGATVLEVQFKFDGVALIERDDAADTA